MSPQEYSDLQNSLMIFLSHNLAQCRPDIADTNGIKEIDLIKLIKVEYNLKSETEVNKIYHPFKRFLENVCPHIVCDNGMIYGIITKKQSYENSMQAQNPPQEEAPEGEGTAN